MEPRFGRSQIRAVVLDAVGTIIDPSPSVAEAYAAAGRRQGIELSLSEVRSRFGKAFRKDEMHDLRGPLGTDEANEVRRWRRIVAEVLPEIPDPQRAFDELWEHFGRPDSWRVFDDVRPFLDGLVGVGLTVSVGSNFDSRLHSVLRGLPEFESIDYQRVQVSSEVGFRKPHPRFYARACEHLQLEPSQVLFIGDDPENDLAGPQRIGAHALLLDRAERHCAVHPRVPSLSPILDALHA